MTQLPPELEDDPTLPEWPARILSRLEEERKERERFYDDVTDDVKAEFINGEIIMHSPAMDRHTQAQANLLTILRPFDRIHRLGKVAHEKALCVFPRNDYEPDIAFFGLEKTALISPTTRKYPVPDFICEIVSDSTESRDRGVKFRDYQANGVGEYWIFDPETGILEQYVTNRRKFELRLGNSIGDVESTEVEGFRIPIMAMSDEDEGLRSLAAMLPRS